MRVDAVVVAWNHADDLEGCLEALAAQTHRDLHVVVVDNASSDHTLEVLDAWVARDPTWLTVVANATNRGFAGGVNDALATSDAPAVLLVNADTRPEPGHVAALVARLEQDPRIGSVQGRLVRTEPGREGATVLDSTGHQAFTTRLFRNRGEGEADRGQHDQASEVFGVTGALSLHRRAMLDDVADPATGEVLDETLFAYFEDVDLDWRARRRGWQAWYEPTAVATHVRGSSGATRAVVVERLNWRNRLLLLAKHETWSSLRHGWAGFLVTLVLKTVELLVTTPEARHGLLPTPDERAAMRAKGLAMRTRDVVPPDDVLARWFEPFRYRRWVDLWWRRVTGRPLG